MIRVSLFFSLLPLAVAACREVDSARIRATDLAAVDARFASMDPQRDIAPAPLAGVRRTFHPEELQRLLRQFGIPDKPSSEAICFERASQGLAPETLLPILAESLAKPGTRIEILDVNRYAVARGRIEFPRALLAPSGLWRGRVVDPEGRSASIWARIRVIDTTTGVDVSLATPPATKLVPAAKAVERGETVRVEVETGGVLLAFDAPAESSGRAGDLVVVKNPSSGTRFKARVESKGKVTVKK